jgi:hypothetical protein
MGFVLSNRELVRGLAPRDFLLLPGTSSLHRNMALRYSVSMPSSYEIIALLHRNIFGNPMI